MGDYKHILLAVDFSPGTDNIAHQADSMRKAFSAELSLVHVVEFVQFDLSNELVMPQELELDKELIDLAEKRLLKLADGFGLDAAACHVRQGSTRREILALAEEIGVDLIVIGSHGRQGLQLLLGSTANAVLHGTPCDVLAVRVRES